MASVLKTLSILQILPFKKMLNQKYDKKKQEIDTNVIWSILPG